MEENLWRVWYRIYDDNGECTCSGVMPKRYTYKGNAARFAKKHFAEIKNSMWWVSKTNPWVSN